MVEKFNKIDLEKNCSVDPFSSYRVEIFSSGLVKYLKGYYTPDSGEYHISLNKVKKLSELLEKYDFFGICKKEPTRFGLDGFECKIKIILKNGSSREIVHSEIEDIYPDTLLKLEDEIEKLINIKSKILG
jgi:hypothetical protein